MMIRLNIGSVTKIYNIRQQLKGLLPDITKLEYDKMIEFICLGFNEKTLIKNLKRKKHTESDINVLQPGENEIRGDRKPIFSMP